MENYDLFGDDLGGNMLDLGDLGSGDNAFSQQQQPNLMQQQQGYNQQQPPSYTQIGTGGGMTNPTANKMNPVSGGVPRGYAEYGQYGTPHNPYGNSVAPGPGNYPGIPQASRPMPGYPSIPPGGPGGAYSSAQVPNMQQQQYPDYTQQQQHVQQGLMRPSPIGPTSITPTRMMTPHQQQQHQQQQQQYGGYGSRMPTPGGANSSQEYSQQLQRWNEQQQAQQAYGSHHYPTPPVNPSSIGYPSRQPNPYSTNLPSRPPSQTVPPPQQLQQQQQQPHIPVYGMSSSGVPSSASSANSARVSSQQPPTTPQQQQQQQQHYPSSMYPTTPQANSQSPYGDYHQRMAGQSSALPIPTSANYPSTNSTSSSGVPPSLHHAQQQQQQQQHYPTPVAPSLSQQQPQYGNQYGQYYSGVGGGPPTNSMMMGGSSPYGSNSSGYVSHTPTPPSVNGGSVAPSGTPGGGYPRPPSVPPSVMSGYGQQQQQQQQQQSLSQLSPRPPIPSPRPQASSTPTTIPSSPALPTAQQQNTTTTNQSQPSSLQQLEQMVMPQMNKNSPSPKPHLPPPVQSVMSPHSGSGPRTPLSPKTPLSPSMQWQQQQQSRPISQQQQQQIPPPPQFHQTTPPHVSQQQQQQTNSPLSYPRPASQQSIPSSPQICGQQSQPNSINSSGSGLGQTKIDQDYNSIDQMSSDQKPEMNQPSTPNNNVNVMSNDVKNQLLVNAGGDNSMDSSHSSSRGGQQQNQNQIGGDENLNNLLNSTSTPTSINNENKSIENEQNNVFSALENNSQQQQQQMQQNVEANTNSNISMTNNSHSISSMISTNSNNSSNSNTPNLQDSYNNQKSFPVSSSPSLPAGANSATANNSQQLMSGLQQQQQSGQNVGYNSQMPYNNSGGQGGQNVRPQIPPNFQQQQQQGFPQQQQQPYSQTSAGGSYQMYSGNNQQQQQYAPGQGPHHPIPSGVPGQYNHGGPPPHHGQMHPQHPPADRFQFEIMQLQKQIQHLYSIPPTPQTQMQVNELQERLRIVQQQQQHVAAQQQSSGQYPPMQPHQMGGPFPPHHPGMPPMDGFNDDSQKGGAKGKKKKEPKEKKPKEPKGSKGKKSKGGSTPDMMMMGQDMLGMPPLPPNLGAGMDPNIPPQHMMQHMPPHHQFPPQQHPGIPGHDPNMMHHQQQQQHFQGQQPGQPPIMPHQQQQMGGYPPQMMPPQHQQQQPLQPPLQPPLQQPLPSQAVQQQQQAPPAAPTHEIYDFQDNLNEFPDLPEKKAKKPRKPREPKSPAKDKKPREPRPAKEKGATPKRPPRKKKSPLDDSLMDIDMDQNNGMNSTDNLESLLFPLNENESDSKNAIGAAGITPPNTEGGSTTTIIPSGGEGEDASKPPVSGTTPTDADTNLSSETMTPVAKPKRPKRPKVKSTTPGKKRPSKTMISALSIMAKKKKRKGSDDEGSDFDMAKTPPPSPPPEDEANSNKRRSARNTQRKKYVDDIDMLIEEACRLPSNSTPKSSKSKSKAGATTSDDSGLTTPVQTSGAIDSIDGTPIVSGAEGEKSPSTPAPGTTTPGTPSTTPKRPTATSTPVIDDNSNQSLTTTKPNFVYVNPHDEDTMIVQHILSVRMGKREVFYETSDEEDDEVVPEPTSKPVEDEVKKTDDILTTEEKKLEENAEKIEETTANENENKFKSSEETDKNEEEKEKVPSEKSESELNKSETESKMEVDEKADEKADIIKETDKEIEKEKEKEKETEAETKMEIDENDKIDEIKKDTEPEPIKTDEFNESNKDQNMSIDKDEKEATEVDTTKVVEDIKVDEVVEETKVSEDKTENTENVENDKVADAEKPPVVEAEPTPEETVEKVEKKKKPKKAPEMIEIEEFYVKFKNFSYLHCEWRTEEELLKGDKRVNQKIKRFKQKMSNNSNMFDFLDEDPFNPEYTEVDRVLDISEVTDPTTGNLVRNYLVKWRSLNYEECTWELEEDVDPLIIAQYKKFCNPPKRDQWAKKKRPKPDDWRKLDDSPVYKNNNNLRPYQLEGVNWLSFSYCNGRNCILADEMGLGKTIQSLAFIQWAYNYGIRGPYLIIAPLSTVPNWQREFETWTDLNVVVYHGSLASRNMIQEYELFYRHPDNNQMNIKDCFKVNVLITTFEIVLTDIMELKDLPWRICIIDEAHRLKNKNCKLLEGLRLLNLEYRVLLSGTPLQNNVNELFSLLNFLEPNQFQSDEIFLKEFGELKTDAQCQKLQALLKPMMLRRLKEDVEKSIAPKEETIIEVELTNMQKKYYRGILEKNFSFLCKGTTSANVPNLMNTMMELRKCCIHPYLLNGAEEQIHLDYRTTHNLKNATEDDQEVYYKALVHSSGKMVLVDKLLPKLKANGHRVLIFSQMVRCLDILEDYLIQKKYPFERIDGRIRGNLRQAAIDRFCKPDSDRFVFLLCTKAGGLGINLTAADTVIIYDSDWNPQNDLQAQARCHRIGQSKMVKVYRLICKNTYEREMFDRASLKLGLDRAVLQSMNTVQGSKSGDPQKQLSKKEVEDLLKRGAYGAIMEEDVNDADKFCEEDIDLILQRRTQVITLESGEKGSTFSKATFASSGIVDIDIDDPDFWKKWAKRAELQVDDEEKNELLIHEPRRRTQIKRFGHEEQLMNISELESSSDSDEDGNIGDRTRGGRKTRGSTKSGRRRRNGDEDFNYNDDGIVDYGRWSRSECYKVERGLLTFGWSRWNEILVQGQFRKGWAPHNIEECARLILLGCVKDFRGDDKVKSFVSDLISPPDKGGASKITRNHSGLANPVSRGGRKKKKRGGDGSDAPEDSIEAVISGDNWHNEDKYNIEIHLDGNYRKHLAKHANKVLLRIRTLYYIKQEIIGDKADKINFGIPASEIHIVPDSLIIDSGPTFWWDKECDSSLLIGTYRHGYERYNVMRCDPSLCFLSRCGPPDGKAVLAEINSEVNEEELEKAVAGDDDDEASNVEKPEPVKRKRKSKKQRGKGGKNAKVVADETKNDPEAEAGALEPGEIRAEGEGDKDKEKDSNSNEVSSTTEITEKEKETAEKEDVEKKSDEVISETIDEEKPQEPETTNPDEGRILFPNCSDLNTRLRKLITSFQRYFKKEEIRIAQKAKKMERKEKIDQIVRERERQKLEIYQKRWSKKEESDFFRTISTYGVYYNSKEDKYDWTKFKSISRLDKKFDETLTEYCKAFLAMCKKAIGRKLTEEEEQLLITVGVEPLQEERAKKTLERIELLSKVREEIIYDPNLDERLQLAQPSLDMPEWWVPGKHDKDLIYGAAKHGLGRTDLFFLNDPELNFREILRRHIAGEPLIDPADVTAKLRKLEKDEKKPKIEPKELEKESSGSKMTHDMVDIEVRDIKKEIEDAATAAAEKDKEKIDKDKDESLNAKSNEEKMEVDEVKDKDKEESTTITEKPPPDENKSKETATEDVEMKDIDTVKIKQEPKDDMEIDEKENEKVGENQEENDANKPAEIVKEKTPEAESTKEKEKAPEAELVKEKTPSEPEKTSTETESNEEKKDKPEENDKESTSGPSTTTEKKQGYEEKVVEDTIEAKNQSKDNDQSKKIEENEEEMNEVQVEIKNELKITIKLPAEKRVEVNFKSSPKFSVPELPPIGGEKEKPSSSADEKVSTPQSTLPITSILNKSLLQNMSMSNNDSMSMSMMGNNNNQQQGDNIEALGNLLNQMNPIRWPRDKCIELRLAHLVHAIEKNEWPVSRFFSSANIPDFFDFTNGPGTPDTSTPVRDTPTPISECSDLAPTEDLIMNLQQQSSAASSTTTNSTSTNPNLNVNSGRRGRRRRIAIDVETERAKLQALLNSSLHGMPGNNNNNNSSQLSSRLSQQQHQQQQQQNQQQSRRGDRFDFEDNDNEDHIPLKQLKTSRSQRERQRELEREKERDRELREQHREREMRELRELKKRDMKESRLQQKLQQNFPPPAHQHRSPTLNSSLLRSSQSHHMNERTRNELLAQAFAAQQNSSLDLSSSGSSGGKRSSVSSATINALSSLSSVTVTPVQFTNSPYGKTAQPIVDSTPMDLSGGSLHSNLRTRLRGNDRDRDRGDRDRDRDRDREQKQQSLLKQQQRELRHEKEQELFREIEKQQIQLQKQIAEQQAKHQQQQAQLQQQQQQQERLNPKQSKLENMLDKLRKKKLGGDNESSDQQDQDSNPMGGKSAKRKKLDDIVFGLSSGKNTGTAGLPMQSPNAGSSSKSSNKSPLSSAFPGLSSPQQQQQHSSSKDQQNLAQNIFNNPLLSATLQFFNSAAGKDFSKLMDKGAFAAAAANLSGGSNPNPNKKKDNASSSNRSGGAGIGNSASVNAAKFLAGMQNQMSELPKCDLNKLTELATPKFDLFSHDAKVNKWLQEHANLTPERPASPTEYLLDSNGRRRKKPQGQGSSSRGLDSLQLDWSKLNGEESVPVVNRVSGKKVAGPKAPQLKHLGQWLLENPLYDVDPKWAELVKEKGNNLSSGGQVDKNRPGSSSSSAERKKQGRPPMLTSPTPTSSSANAFANFASIPGLSGLNPNLLAGMGSLDPKNPLFMPFGGLGQLGNLGNLGNLGMNNPLFGFGFPGMTGGGGGMSPEELNQLVQKLGGGAGLLGDLGSLGASLGGKEQQSSSSRDRDRDRDRGHQQQQQHGDPNKKSSSKRSSNSSSKNQSASSAAAQAQAQQNAMLSSLFPFPGLMGYNPLGLGNFPMGGAGSSSFGLGSSASSSLVNGLPSGGTNSSSNKKSSTTTSKSPLGSGGLPSLINIPNFTSSSSTSKDRKSSSSSIEGRDNSKDNSNERERERGKSHKTSSSSGGGRQSALSLLQEAASASAASTLGPIKQPAAAGASGENESDDESDKSLLGNHADDDDNLPEEEPNEFAERVVLKENEIAQQKMETRREKRERMRERGGLTTEERTLLLEKKKERLAKEEMNLFREPQRTTRRSAASSRNKLEETVTKIKEVPAPETTESEEPAAAAPLEETGQEMEVDNDNDNEKGNE